jgi:DNA end-binding protein Ku
MIRLEHFRQRRLADDPSLPKHFPMSARSGWKGYLQISLVSIPVKSYTAVNSCSGSRISLNQLHEECHSRIRYAKTCPIHGEVSADEIVSGYEYSKGNYAVIDPAELDQLRTESDRAVKIQAVFARKQINPLYLGGKTAYLVPDGPIGQRPYALVQQALAEGELAAVAQVVLNGKEETVLLWTLDRLIAMTSLNYEEEVKLPATFEHELSNPDWSVPEMKMTKALLESLKQKHFEISDYKDLYAERLKLLIDSKVEGKELVAPESSDETPHVINLMDALRKSLEQAHARDPKVNTSRVQKKAAKKSNASTPVRRKKKTG